MLPRRGFSTVQILSPLAPLPPQPPPSDSEDEANEEKISISDRCYWTRKIHALCTAQSEVDGAFSLGSYLPSPSDLSNIIHALCCSHSFSEAPRRRLLRSRASPSPSTTAQPMSSSPASSTSAPILHSACHEQHDRRRRRVRPVGHELEPPHRSALLGPQALRSPPAVW